MSGVSFPQALANVAERDADAVAAICGERTITRGELDRASNRMARAYSDRGVAYGDLVTVALPNGIEFLIACMAAWKLGAVPNPISPALPPPERDAIIERAEPSLIVGIDADPAAMPPRLPAGFVPDASVSDASLPDQTSPIERALTSGGSTGRPKLILTASQAVYDPASPLAMFAAKRAMLIPGPLYHGIPFASTWRSILAGAKVVVMERFDAAQCLELISRHGVDRVSFVPTMMLRIARLPDDERARHDVSSLEFVLTSGSPCPPWLMQFWIDWVGPQVMNESFGSTERIGGTFINGREWVDHPGSVGRPVGGSQIRILDPETGDERPAGEVGEVYMMPPTGPGSSYKYVGAERRTTSDGWESVGDMGYLDTDGYLYLADRRDDMILCRGRNVFPAEIEAAIESHPNVRSSAVIGLPDDDLGNSVHAIVEVSGVTAAELAKHVAARLVHYKVPKTFELVDHPLRDDSGKVRRSALRQARLSKVD
ncbi:MAG TPA: AMP-binding protein [Ilumatobacter sp.]|nr:AMP-binding protein [Ilumatobacter sp.]